jgi:AFG3 family protein
VRKVANLLLEKEVITRSATIVSLAILQTDALFREDMVRLLGKRPFKRHDDMDKWLDENQKQTQPQPVDPPVESLDNGPSPAPVPAFKRIDQQL